MLLRTFLGLFEHLHYYFFTIYAVCALSYSMCQKCTVYLSYFNTCTMHLLLFCAMTNKCTIISQIITLLHVLMLLYHPQGACNQYLAKLHKYFKYSFC